MRLFVAVLTLGMAAPSVLADNLPPAAVERGSIRRNAVGQVEAIALPAAAQAPSSPAADKVGDDKAPSPAPAGRTIIVGPLQQVRTIKEAARLARDGDTIEILPGVYRQQATVWLQSRLTIRGIGKRPVLIADGASAEGKALWVVRNGEMLIENIEFRGVRVPDGNGAGIRFERGHLKIVRCAFFDNEMGILTGNVADAVLEIDDSEFGDAPRHAGLLHHLLYAGTIGRLIVRGSSFQQGFRGHLIKSRARENSIRYNLLVDGAGGSASYELEFPNGGLAWVIGNIIGQSASTDNSDLVSYGAEGRYWSDNALYLAHNTLLNDRLGGRFLHVWWERMPSGTEVWAINNLLVGQGDFTPQAPGRYDGNQAVDRALLVAADALAFALPGNSPLRGVARHPGFVRDQSLLPTAEFHLPAGVRPLVAGKPLSAGALQ